MSIDVSPQELTWLKRFFSGQNDLKWQDIESGQGAASRLAQVTPWLKFLSGSTIDHPIVLPLYGLEGGVAWYGMTADDQMFSQLVEEIGSFIGPSYSDFQGDWSDIPGNSDLELALKERFENRVLRFGAQRPEDQLEIERALLLYQNLLARRPVMPERTQRPFGKIRGDFDRALLAGNANNAQVLLDELKATGRVDAGQQKCLEVRMLAGLGRQEELARNQPLISSVTDLALPTQTLVDVIDALYETYIRPIEARPDLGEILAAFRQHISRPFGSSLFRDRKGIRHPTVLRAFLLFELVQGEPNLTRCNSIISAYADAAEGRDLAERWYIPQSAKQDEAHQLVEIQTSLEMARQAIADEDYEIAYELCFELLPDYWAYSALLRCAVELGSVDVTKKTIEVVTAASSDVKSLFKPKDRERLESLGLVGESSNSETLDLSWIGWAQGIQNGASIATSITMLNKSIDKWSVDEYAHDIDRCALLAKLIGNASGDQEAIYREAFPSLVGFFVERPVQSYRAFTPIYATLIKILGWSGVLSPDELEIASTLTHALLTTGPSQSVYIECVEDLNEIIAANNSPVYLDWALNTSELLVLYPAQDGGDLRLRVFMQVITMVSTSPHRVTPTQRDILEILAKDYGCQNLLESLPTCDNEREGFAQAGATKFNGLIGIYTLTEGAGQRAKSILEKYFPDARVETNKDHAATDRLVALAKNADIFVFAWKSSKHQAYFCVKDARGAKEIVMPSGKGTASIVKSILERITG
ncbi:protein DpdD [Ferrovum myxofaciens]|uniref:Uncharacterized protein n=1 Tax=Ferrovum myxofaciens TaxID=416213 RepID=A0A9E6MZU2_9PROT|nr:protein DpdD [Ferrovum myxofaciens]QKE37686.1 MAG: hypothetical protein HO273_02170 [Ferrovum myxofaciens]QWY75347.1 MAG: hypothetical protein JVY19_02605 [Ferrovum myxofaciens]QWY78087.1 MAG: hypothetical protein JZL65_03125 [Ferrovum myxofaciens]